MLTAITFFPLVGLALILLLPGRMTRAIQAVSVATTFIVFLMSVGLMREFRPTGGLQFVQRADWISVTRDGASQVIDNGRYVSKVEQYTYDGKPIKVTSSIQYFVGADGLSVSLIFLTGLLALLSNFYTLTIKKQVKAFHALYMILVCGMMGVFVSMDLFLFYVFWEVMLLPMYFLIGIWGGPRREYAAIKFFLYTLIGSVLMLIAVIGLYMVYGTFSIPDLIQIQPWAGSVYLSQLAFWGFFIAFAVKIPMFPFHTWLPDAHVEAPTAISAILAGVLLKLGGYGVFRICLPMFAGVTLDVLYLLAVLGLINIVYGAMVAMAQRDFKKLVAYSSVSHMGFLLLGIAGMNAEGMNGAYFQMFSHGLNSAMMFMAVGVLYERAHHRDLNRFGGMANQMPLYFALATVAFFASLGLPGMSGFISEMLVFLGAFKAFPWITGFAVIGVIMTAAFILWMIQRVYLGTIREEYKSFEDINGWELAGIAPLAFFTILLGIYPNIVIDLFDEDLRQMIDFIKTAGAFVR